MTHLTSSDTLPPLDALAEKYGQQLQLMTMPEKLVSIAVLAAALHEHDADPTVPISVEWQLSEQEELIDITGSLGESLRALDACNRKEVIGLIQTLAACLT
jgi:hypothetical protein